MGIKNVGHQEKFWVKNMLCKNVGESKTPFDVRNIIFSLLLSKFFPLHHITKKSRKMKSQTVLKVLFELIYAQLCELTSKILIWA